MLLKFKLTNTLIASFILLFGCGKIVNTAESKPQALVSNGSVIVFVDVSKALGLNGSYICWYKKIPVPTNAKTADGHKKVQWVTKKIGSSVAVKYSTYMDALTNANYYTPAYCPNYNYNYSDLLLGADDDGVNSKVLEISNEGCGLERHSRRCFMNVINNIQAMASSGISGKACPPYENAF